MTPKPLHDSSAIKYTESITSTARTVQVFYKHNHSGI